ncbi:hypothetical protein FRACYDRAFT_247046 [Fragilariopsis cylindrus CCMP1102]|uniref:Uncharacterized protein n=1 Tax=Fragilariopsis cylindrus CCMP1102 TaxID=635003 RepID=A0A1E7EXC8_9STRA|nr:hypothetical protein FRACYDRAFT_247046 [Fragilariopsis cylindrus CCMP1102]|eukprot:OEU10507.1 hypothetical protein FRACYDRAFT_247046 [Fragilariopsis cylindrus CCMP1102]
MVTTTTATRSSLPVGSTIIKISCLIVLVVVILLISSPLPVNSLSLQSQSQSQFHNHNSVLINGGGHQQKQRHGQFLQQRQVFLSPQVGQQQLSRHSSILYLKSTAGNNNNNDNDDDDNININEGVSLLSLETIGLLCQPVVWISLYFVKTTGGGLPAGPGGIIGAIEGLSYLLVVIFAFFPSLLPSSSFDEQQQQDDNGDDDDSAIVTTTTKTMTIVEVTTLSSRITLVLGLLTLIGLIVDQGCIPNAKPILDYSAYLPICNIPPS